MSINVQNNTPIRVPVFRENQVLRAESLNDLVDIVVNQLRQNRIYNIGLGIVEGFTFAVDVQQGEIIVERGFGVSSDGYAFDMPKCRFNYITKAAINLGDVFLATPCDEFADLLAIINETAYELGELGEDNFSDNWIRIKDWHIENQVSDQEYCLLYVYLEELSAPSACFNECEAKGANQMGEYRAYLLPKADYQKIFQKEESKEEESGLTEQEEVADEKGSDELLPNIKLRAFGGIEGGDALSLCEIEDWRAFFQSYHSACLQAIPAMEEAYAAIKEKVPNAEPITKVGDSLDRLLSIYTALESEGVCTDIQYVYSLFSEIIQAYEALYQLLEGGKLSIRDVEVANDNFSRCLFPGHLNLGGIQFVEGKPTDRVNKDCQSIRLFPSSTATSSDLYQQAQALCATLDAVVNSANWRLPTIVTRERKAIRITPSLRSHPFLQGRALPFYYSRTILADWRRGPQPNNDTYYYSEADANHPLLFLQANWDFYRIEGHLGKQLGDWDESNNPIGVLPELMKLRERFNLAFDIKAIRINSSENDSRVGRIVDSDRERWYKNTRADLLAIIYEFYGEKSEEIDAFLFLEKHKSLASIFADWGGVEVDSYCEDLPTSIISVSLSRFLADYDSLVEKLKSADSNLWLDEQLALCIHDAAIEEKLTQLAIARSQSFPGFSKLNPGMVHMGGVPKGGTFILVYKEEESEEDNEVTGTIKRQVVADFCLPYSCCDDQQQLDYLPPKRLSATADECWDSQLDSFTIQLCVGEVGGKLSFPQLPEEEVRDIKEEVSDLNITAISEDNFEDGLFALEVLYDIDGRLETSTVEIFQFPEPNFEALTYANSWHFDSFGDLLLFKLEGLIEDPENVQLTVQMGTQGTQEVNLKALVLQVPLAVVRDKQLVEFQFTYRNCRKDFSWDPCKALPRGFNLAGDCSIVDSCNIDCPSLIGRGTSPEVELIIDPQKLPLGVVELQPYVPGGDYEVILEETGVMPDSTFNISGIVLKHLKTVAGSDHQVHVYYLVFDVSAFLDAAKEESASNDRLLCFRDERDGTFPFEAPGDSQTVGSLTSATLRYRIGSCESVEQTIRIKFEATLEPQVFKESQIRDKNILSQEAGRILNQRQAKYVNQLKTLQTTDRRFAGTAAYKRTQSFVMTPSKSTELAAKYLKAYKASLNSYKRASGDKKLHYEQLLTTLHLAWLDKLMVNPETNWGTTNSILNKSLRGLQSAGYDLVVLEQAWQDPELQAELDKVSWDRISNLIKG